MPASLQIERCQRCGAANSHTHQRCRHCGERLPWATPRESVRVKSRPRTVRERITRWVQTRDWEKFGLFWLAFLFPPIGFLLYSTYTRSGSEKAGPVLWGAIAGVFFWAWRVLSQPTAHIVVDGGDL